MQRRNFIYFSSLAVAHGFLMPPILGQINRMDANTPTLQLLRTSLARQFLMKNIQEVAILNRLVAPELCNLANTDRNHKVPGNAFATGTVTFLNQEVLYNVFNIAKEGYQSNPLDLKTQELIAFAMGNLVFKVVNDTLVKEGANNYFEDEKLAVALDAQIIWNYYLKKPFPKEMKSAELSLFFRTLISRSQIGYHTLKCQKEQPLAWLEANIAWKKQINAHSNALAAKLLNGNTEVMDTNIFNPLDPILKGLSNFRNFKMVDRELIDKTLDRSKGSCALALAFASGLQAFIDMNKRFE